MPISVVQLGSPRKADEGLRLGTVRRPPRGVPKSEWAKRDFYDLWFPLLSPTQDLVAFALSAKDEAAWKIFERKFTAEMNKPDPARVLDLLAACPTRRTFRSVATASERIGVIVLFSANCSTSAEPLCPDVCYPFADALTTDHAVPYSDTRRKSAPQDKFKYA